MVVVGLVTCERVVLGKGAKKMKLMARRRGKWRSRGESNTQHERMEMTHGV